MRKKKANSRLSTRQLKIWHEDYLVYRYLWPNLDHTIQKALQALGKDLPIVLDVGCGNKPYQDWFGDSMYVGLNYSIANAEPDVVGDAMQLAFANESFDLVFATQVLEHLSEPSMFLEESFRVLRPGGIIILSCPFYWPLHEEPHDYYRFTKYGLAHLLKLAKFRDPEIIADGGGWAQAFLAIGLQIPYRLRFLRIITNVLGLALDRVLGKESSTSNYTLLDRK